ncbi:hypothetical protein TKWG_22890 [Advenella kashmirensis WT001]|uniref:Uncharacterized protein n=1 Tax=Advenella kashmirensis (strain DSM 17095 / LMG 22695 / WT001) TaxID=1036672 RepID=I3UGQ6_ADVKW|nr:hypothetical protein [Advenella kashmirensis]AFK64194.1 hypothetical protein TKWG_22890 [Advenella kashmirensis WT001]
MAVKKKSKKQDAESAAQDTLLDNIKIKRSAVPNDKKDEVDYSIDAIAPKFVKYEERIVAFVDILGFKEIVLRSQKDPDLVNQIYNGLDVRKDELARHFVAELGLSLSPEDFDDRFHTFSDCIVMSVDSKIEELGLLIFMIFKICRQLLLAGFLSRGGVAIGQLLHLTPESTPGSDRNSSMVFGPAFVDAYNLESSHAGCARIILQQKLRQMIHDHRQKHPYKKLTKFFDAHVSRADDGPAFVNQFADFPGNNFYEENVDVQPDIKAIQAHLQEKLNEVSDKPYHFQKNAILAREFNNAIKLASKVPRYADCKKYIISSDALPGKRRKPRR